MRIGPCALLLLGILATARAFASEATLDDEPAPASAEAAKAPLDAGLEKLEPRIPSALPRVAAALQDLPPFLRDTQLVLHPRSYYFNRSNHDEGDLDRAWAYGGWVRYRSGRFREMLSAGAALYTTQRAWGKRDEDGTLLLGPRNTGFAVLGEAYGRLHWRDTRFTGYRQLLDLPYLNRRDNRMVPVTHQGYTLIGSEEIGGYGTLSFAAGWIDEIKLRAAKDFVSMAEAAGVPDSGKGMAFGGLLWSGERLSAGAVNYFVGDVYNTLYAEADYYLALVDPIQLRIGTQFTDQRSVGRDLVTGSSYDTRNYGVRLVTSTAGAVLTLAFSTTDREEGIRSPWGSFPGYLSLMQRSFNRAGEDGWLVGLSYDFGRIGLRGWSAFTNIARGTGARDPRSGKSLPDRTEVDLTIDFRPREGFLDRFWLRIRGSLVDEDGAGQTRRELRVILNYDFSLL